MQNKRVTLNTPVKDCRILLNASAGCETKEELF